MTSPPSRELAPVTDALTAKAIVHLEGVVKNLDEMGGEGPLKDAGALRIVLDVHARDQERIGELEGHLESHGCTNRALLGEAQDV